MGGFSGKFLKGFWKFLRNYWLMPRSDGGGSCGGGSVGGFNDDGGSDDHGGLKHQGGFDHHGERGNHRGPFAVLQAPVSYYRTLNYNSSAWSLLFLNKLMKMCFDQSVSMHYV